MRFFKLLRGTFSSWQEDKAPQLAASTAYYTVFSLAPLLIILIGIAGFFFDSAAVRQQLLAQVTTMVGAQGAQTVDSMLTAANRSGHSLLATVVGFVMLLLGASGLLLSLQYALNFIWKVEVRKQQRSIWLSVLKRVFSVGLLLSLCFLLLVSLGVSAAVTVMAHMLSSRLPVLQIALPALDLVLSFGVTTLLFAVLFKFLPDVRLVWKDVWMGAALTSLLFTVGKMLLGWYLGQKDFVSAYGAAGSLIVLLLWVNYSAQILFFGVEFTKAYSEDRHLAVVPRSYARFIR